MASPVPTGYRDDGYDLADLRDRVGLFSAQNKMLDNQVRQNSGSIKFNFRTINVILVLCIAGSSIGSLTGRKPHWKNARPCSLKSWGTNTRPGVSTC